mmetsp:Transcript_5548/g.13891  ORF Transcript_5548/g.13891 Transcript_5548/m.13891 type:complete len:373 (-) Transcript_5548:34-1152(-)
MAENNTENDNNSDGTNDGKVSALHDLIAGGVAGSASVIVGHPFDTIKVRIQTSINNSNGSSSSSPISSLRSLFKGMAAPLSTAAVVNAIIFASYGTGTRLWEDYFENGHHDDVDAHGAMTGEGAVFIERGEHGTHEQIKDWKGGDITNSLSQIESELPTVTHINPAELEKTKQQQNHLKIFTCGAVAGTVQAFVICPMEHIKCRLQVNTQQLYKGPLDACASIVNNHGLFHGLYRGMGVTLWRETPAFGMYFATYDAVKERVENLLEEKDEKHPIPSHAHAWAASALAGGISGAWTWAIIYPFDVIKSKIQTSPLESRLRKGMWTVGHDLIREHGWKHMFRGLGVTLVRAFPVNAIIFPVYEFVLVQLGDGD